MAEEEKTSGQPAIVKTVSISALVDKYLGEHPEINFSKLVTTLVEKHIGEQDLKKSQEKRIQIAKLRNEIYAIAEAAGVSKDTIHQFDKEITAIRNHMDELKRSEGIEPEGDPLTSAGDLKILAPEKETKYWELVQEIYDLRDKYMHSCGIHEKMVFREVYEKLEEVRAIKGLPPPTEGVLTE